MTPLADDPWLRDVPTYGGFKVLQKCVLLQRLGQGGFGGVYRAWHLSLDMPVAVKCLDPEWADDERLERLRQEAKLAAELSSEHIVQIRDADTACGLQYLVLELVQGESAGERLRRMGKLDGETALAIAEGAARALAAAHARGVIHRDIKPDNILLSNTGRVVVADFGIATAINRDNVVRTAADVVLGTLPFLPPEDFESDREPRPTADVYSLGATLFLLLTGLRPVQGKDALQVQVEVLRRPCLDPAPHGVRDPVAEIVRRATARRPEDRYADAGEMLAAIAAARGPRPIADVVAESGAPHAMRTVKEEPSAEQLATIRREKEAAEKRGEGGPLWPKIVAAAAVLVAGAAGLAYGLGGLGPGVEVPDWAELVRAEPDPDVVKDSVVRARIAETGYAWVVRDRQSGIEMVLIPPGTYRRGAAPDDDLAEDDERPAHPVTLTRAFYLGRSEVTNAQFAAFDAEHASGEMGRETLEAPTQPAVKVSFAEAEGFCRRFGFRLPTEAEWEYACRAGTGTRFPWGSAAEGGKGWANVLDTRTASRDLRPEPFPFEDAYYLTAPVRQYPPNGFGVFDMFGNASEWCADAWDADAYAGWRDGVTDPLVRGAGSPRRVRRGGDYDAGPADARLSARQGERPDLRADYVGFRVARAP